jgi:hypothetical protein
MTKPFDYSLDYENLNLRQQPELYRVGKGEQGVLLVEPYKSEILPHWRFRTPDIAEESSTKIFEMFEQYKADGDFVGMDMARKFLQMGWTRARRYANHKGGRKYVSNPQKAQSVKEEKRLREEGQLPLTHDLEKAQAAAIFYEKYVQAREDVEYKRLKKEHQTKYG